MSAPNSAERAAAAADIQSFSTAILGRTLRPYQAEAAEAIIRSVREQSGLTFTVMMARQMGKNELSAIVEAYLLNLYRRRGGTVIKAAPTLRPQGSNSRRRLLRMLDNPVNRGRAHVEENAVVLGRARCQILSGSTQANVVGGTADLLLELDEAQDLDDEKIQRDFLPMAASTNATRVLYGTAWDDGNPLELHKLHHLELERQDGIKRHFEADWEVLAALNPNYKRFVQGEIARLGVTHPIIQTQYCLKALDSAGKLFVRAVRELMTGRHAALEHGADGETYVAGVDVAGQDNQLPEGVMNLGRALGGRDSTVVTIGRVRWTEDHEPAVEIVAHYAWAGADFHAAQINLRHILREVFPVTRVAVDATGLGAGPAAWLARELGKDRVEQFQFTGPSKSRAGFTMLAMCGTGRCTIYADNEAEDIRVHRARFLREAEVARYSLRFNEQLSYGVPQKEGHDDYLMSMALLCHAASQAPAPPESAIIPPHTPEGLRQRPHWADVY